MIDSSDVIVVATMQLVIITCSTIIVAEFFIGSSFNRFATTNTYFSNCIHAVGFNFACTKLKYLLAIKYLHGIKLF
jgi:hypothetical protein